MSKVALESLGCKLNQAEMEALADRLVGRGHILTESVDEADAYVLNTCTVTHVADRKSRQALRAARRANPGARVIASGCYARRAAGELERLRVVDVITSDVEAERILDAIERGGRVRTTEGAVDGRRGWSRTRSLVKIQEGCSDFCSFCIVPFTRGAGRSRAADVILAEIKDRLARGYKEVVLTGTKIGEYRWNGTASAGLPELIRRILAETDVQRLRVSSLQPADLTSDMLALWRDDRLCPHLHLPLQSGSTAVLRKMHRPYSLAEYEGAVCRARDSIPDLSITTDILVGFPGESQSDYEDGCRVCERMGFSGIHVFPYSKRPGTLAASMPSQVDERAKKQRSLKLMALAQRSAAEFRSRFLGRKMPVLWEERSGDGIWSGHTANYLRVYAKSDKGLGGEILAARMTEEYAGGLGGEMANGGYDG